MRFRTLGYQLATVAGVVLGLGLCGVDPARADVISASPTLPVLDGSYIAIGGAGCFNTAHVCVTAGSLTLLPPVSNTFSGSGEDILSDAVFTGLITDLGGTPLGLVTLQGTAEQDVIGRLSATATGSWTTDLTGLTLSGPALGATLTLGLDASPTSSGNTSIVPLGNNFLISSFFSVFVDLNLSGTPPLSASRGPITFEVVPEPISLFVLAPAGLALLVARRRGGAKRG
jgi:hypothetical protein